MGKFVFRAGDFVIACPTFSLDAGFPGSPCLGGKAEHVHIVFRVIRNEHIQWYACFTVYLKAYLSQAPGSSVSRAQLGGATFS